MMRWYVAIPEFERAAKLRVEIVAKCARIPS